MTFTVAAPPARSAFAARLDAASELSLVAVTAASAISLDRLFVPGDQLTLLLVHAVFAHLVLAAVRRRGLTLAVSGLAALAGLTVAVGWLHYPSTTVLGIPTPDTLDSVQADFDVAWAQFGDLPTPTEPLLGFVVVCAAAIWVSAFVADWAAFRLSVPIEAILPAGTVFVFSAVLADNRGRTWATVSALVAAFAFLLVQRVRRQVERQTWVTDDRRRGANALLGAGALLSVVAIAAASMFAPSLPGAGSDAIVDLEPGNDGPSSRVTISPLVDIRRRLVDQSDIQVFTVESAVRSYWRLTSLDEFDGRIWSSSGSYGRAEGGLPSAIDSATTAETVTQRYSITALAAIWLPVAFEPRAVESDLDLRYDEVSSTLIVDTDIIDSDGATYTVESALPRFDPAALAAAGNQYPVEVLDEHLALPPDFSSQATQLARDITNGSPNTYEAALRLQNFFRNEFTYDLSVPEGHSGDDLERFLFGDRRGYCEQFSGAFAAMARAVNIPARVAVGFTPGEEVEPGRFAVRGENAHAWPEIYLPGQGWVLFEPTPGRGAPFAENYTNVPEQQATSGDPTSATTLPVPDTVPEQTEGPAVPEAADDVDASGDAASLDDPAAEPDPSGFWDSIPLAVRVAAAAVAVGVIAYVLAVPAIHRRRRERRRRAAVTAAQRIGVAWDETLEGLSLVSFTPDRAATHRETAVSAAAHLPGAADLPGRVAAPAELATYASELVTDDDVRDAVDAAGGVAVAVRERTSVTDRAKRSLDVRPLLPTRIRRRIDRV